jgi:hypothetical protein
LKIWIDRFDARLARSVIVPAIDTRIVILGAGFGGLELATSLSEELGDSVEVTLIDKNDAFVFGYSKLDVMSGARRPRRSGSPTVTSRSREFASCRRRSPRSIPRRGA